MAANDVFLIRETQIFVKYTGCTSVEVTSTPTYYGGVTGVEATDVVSVPGAAPVDGYAWTFTDLVGGSSLNAGVQYFIRDATGSDFKLAQYQGGPAIDFTTDITSGTSGVMQPAEIMVWSNQYRDQFNATGLTIETGDVTTIAGASLLTSTVALAEDISLVPAVFSPSTPGYVTGTPLTTNSDEFAHFPLRQTLLPRSFWRFTMNTVPNVLYAEVLPGDILSNNAPNSNPTA